MEPSAVRTAIAQQHAARLQHEADAADADAHAAADRAELARTNRPSSAADAKYGLLVRESSGRIGPHYAA